MGYSGSGFFNRSPFVGVAAIAFLMIAPVFVEAQQNSAKLIVGFQERVLKLGVAQGGAEFRSALKPLMPSARRRALSTGTLGRLKRNLVNSIARGQQRYFKFIDAKTVVSSYLPNDSRIAAASRLGLIRYVNPDITIRSFALPDDPEFGLLWGLRNTTGGFFSTRDIDINAPEAWDISTGSESVVVGILDTGIDPSHPDLKENVWVNQAEIPGNGKDDDNNGYIDDVYGCNFTRYEQDGSKSCGTLPYNQHYHGTHVAGTIGARGNNGIGISGVAQRVKMVSLAFLDSQGSGSLTDMIEGMEYALTLKRRAKRGLAGGADIRAINGSFGHNEGFMQAEFDALKALENGGILFVAAAGNGGRDGLGDNNDTSPTYPSSYDIDSIISVASIGRNGALSYFSNYGAQSVDIAAPGASITSTVFNGKYAAESGTSMAAPHVTGAIALLFAVKPDLSPWIAKQMILASGKDAAVVAALQALTGKLRVPAILDVEAMLKLSAEDVTRPRIVRDPVSQVVPRGASFSLSVQAFASSTLSYRWIKDGRELNGSDRASLTIRNADENSVGNYYCVIRAGNQSAQSAPAKISISEAAVADINGDGKVNFTDVMALFGDIGKKGEGLKSDLNQDQVVDFADLQVLLKALRGAL